MKIMMQMKMKTKMKMQMHVILIRHGKIIMTYDMTVYLPWVVTKDQSEGI